MKARTTVDRSNVRRGRARKGAASSTGAGASASRTDASRDAPRPARAPRDDPAQARRPRRILVIDVGGTKVKVLVAGEVEPRKMASGKRMTPEKLVERVKDLAQGWRYDAISIGYPGLVGANGPRSEPGNLGPGWVGFNFAAAFERPVRIINDAAMQALGSYDGGRMLFIGLGTGLGSTLIVENVIVPLELGALQHRGAPLWESVGRRGLAQLGKKEWRAVVGEMLEMFSQAFVVDHIVLGGGNAKLVKELPPHTHIGNNRTAFRGGFRLWNLPAVQTIGAAGEPVETRDVPEVEWRVL